ncbi:midnolin-like [Ctenopharyngodon idella]|uniref:midnolin-like n=1 Tax=Ctenopharyngodon idella TaxID=7959 RepID=UPI002231A6BD|nr:midnolin-like [Ctenopharyngodon idella]XP_051725433.1 midnolin-like [Ctenopharyngodon idella]
MERNTEARSCSRSRCPDLLHSDTSMKVSINSTTGTRFELSVPPEETVDGLKRRLAEKLRVPKERLLLLHRDARLSSGKLLDFGVVDGSRLTLMPTVEAGLMSQSWRPEQSVLQALESLTDAQVSDFLSGRSPLTLALRVGDHMMFVQLQLAAQQSVGQPSVSRGPAGTNHIHQPDAQHSTGPAPPSPPVSHAHCGQSPAPAPPRFQAEGSTQSPRQRCKPGAVIESLVNHAPGVFSGTFSGTLHPNCQDGSGRPRRDITTILQILNDLLSATRHYQGTPPTLAHLRCQTPCPPAAPCSPPPSPTSDGQQHRHLRRPSGERLRQTENKATRCKVEQLRLLLRQRRLRRKARRDTRGPYHWLTERKAARSHSNSSLSSDGSLDLDFEEPVWKPDVSSDMNTEFVVA